MNWGKIKQQHNYRTYRKRPKKPRKRVLKIHRYAKELKANLPASEEWFWKLFKKQKNINSKEWLSNTVICDKFIADVYHTKSKTIIEVDGGYHQDPKQVFKDQLRDLSLRKRGYTIHRVTAYSQESFENTIKKLTTNTK